MRTTQNNLPASRPKLKSLLPIALAALLAACGGGSGTSVVSTDPSTQPTETPLASDQPLVDTAVYSGQPAGQITSDLAKEGVAVTHHEMTLNGQKIRYTATAGHLTTVDNKLSTPRASMFYVAFTKDGEAPGTRPVTFIYNGGPGSAASWLMLGSFSPRRVNSDNFPDTLPPAPYTLEDNPDTLIDKTDLVYINPVGTGYSAAIAPLANKDFWTTDSDADSIRDFVQRYLSINRRWNSPKYLMGESYGGPRTAITSWRLQTAGIPLNGVTLISPILTFTERGNLLGALPTMAMAAWYHKVNDAKYQSLTEDQMADAARAFTKDVYTPFALNAKYPLLGETYHISDALRSNLKDDPTFESRYLDVVSQAQPLTGPGFGIDGVWSYLYSPTNPAFVAQTDADVKAGADLAALKKKYAITYLLPFGSGIFSQSVLASQNKITGAYDARTAVSAAGIIRTIPNDAGANDPTIVAVNGAYTGLWQDYIAGDLKYSTTSSFVSLNNNVFNGWSYDHTLPDGSTTSSQIEMDSRPDLAASMSLNPYLKVVGLGGYYDQVTPFYQTQLDLQSLPIDPALQKNITFHAYGSGHMLYLDTKVRTQVRKDLDALYAPLSTTAAAQ
ncbi:S10 family peptidase [Amphibiibacter pelophylacis]|uniref:Peptidase S1 n=1 Tax=Amphibiibacter pelophylacis TaxID=1799477 RepID=A0ACC6NZV7_9BURK